MKNNKYYKTTNLGVLKLEGQDVVINSVALKILMLDNNDDILLATGTTVPTDGSIGFAKGCEFIDTNVAGGTGATYLNKGTITSSAFTLVTQA